MILPWLLLGSIAGIIAGLLPGLHSNNVAILLAASPFFGEEISIFMLGMCITQSFTEFIPSIFLGAPSENTFESILPAHRMLLEGKALEAVCCTVLGGLIAVLIGSALTPFFFSFIEQNTQQIITSTPFILAFALLIFILGEKNWKKSIWAAFIVIAAASQGMLFEGQIFPLITGYFGIAGTLHSLREHPAKAKQEEKAEVGREHFGSAIIGLIGGALVSVMPGIGSNTAAGIINVFKKNNSSKGYLTMLGSINASNFFFSFATLFALSKARNGTMLALKDKMFFTPEMLYIGTLSMIAAAGIGGLATIILSKKAMGILDEQKTKKLSIASIILMIALVGIFCGGIGIVTLFFATALGLLTITTGVRRSTCMSALIVPVMFFYIFILS
ncbi:Tripartite tricarboxylate transporter TctA family protein [uncultured archaeon]|nr:Tripartite tricarboxylate transporter TctA family protein [uncultured archaeon]